LSAPTGNQIYGLPANPFSPSPGTTLGFRQKKGFPFLIPDWTYFYCPGATRERDPKGDVVWGA